MKESEEQFRSTFEQAAVGILHTAIDGSFIRVNQKFCDILGYTRKELYGMSFFALTHPDDANISSDSLQKVFTGVVPMVSFEKRYIRKDSLPVWVNVTSSLKRDASNAPEYFITIVQDISARKNTEMSLILSESRLKSAQSMAHVGNWEIDLATKLLWASEECFNIYGIKYTPALPVIPLSLVQTAVHSDDRLMMDEALYGLVSRGQKYDVEFRIIRADDGEIRYIHSVARLEHDEIGKPSKVIGVFRDITDKKLTELELKKSELKHRAMIANIADVIAIMGPDGIIKYKSPNIESKFGWKPDDLVGTNGWETVHPDDLQRVQSKFASLIEKDNNTDTVEYRYKCKNGNYTTIELTAINMINDININGILMNYRDVSERKRAQLEYRAILQTTTDGFWIVDHSGKFQEVNDAYCDLVGYSRDELLNMSIVGIEAMEDAYGVAERISKVLEKGSARFESKHRCKNGKLIDVEISCNAIKGNFDRICVFLRDITERKQRETEIIYLGNHDILTGLYNRTFFDEEVTRLDTARQMPLSIIIGDINGLKLTNDVFGHSEGDRLLIEIANVLKKCCRVEDIIARIGGDEFCILLPQTDSEVAKEIRQRIYDVCDEHEVLIEGRPFHPSISLGFGTKNFPEQSLDEVIKIAEDSMYKRKLLERKSMHSSLVSSIRATMLEKSHDTKEHADRLISMTKIIGNKMNLESDQIYELELLATLHDIGKIGIDERILSSPNRLTDEEWVEMKRHPEIGYRIALASPELVPIANGILYHHERWDGKGYPQGLAGSRIPLNARILAVVDAYDAMTHDRVYRKAMSQSEAVMQIEANAGSQFDPEIVPLFLDIQGL